MASNLTPNISMERKNHVLAAQIFTQILSGAVLIKKHLICVSLKGRSRRFNLKERFIMHKWSFLASMLPKLSSIRLQRHKNCSMRGRSAIKYSWSSVDPCRPAVLTLSSLIDLQLAISISHLFGCLPPALPAVCTEAQREFTSRRFGTWLIKREVTNNFSSQTNKSSQSLLVSTSQKTRFTDFCLLNDPSPNKEPANKSDFHRRMILHNFLFNLFIGCRKFVKN